MKTLLPKPMADRVSRPARPLEAIAEDEQSVRSVLDRLQQELRKCKGGRLDRSDARRRINQMAQIAEAEYGVLLPSVADGRNQVQRAVNAVSAAAKAVRAAYAAVAVLEDDAYESLFGGVVKKADPKVTETTSLASGTEGQSQCERPGLLQSKLDWGDPEKPLTPADYDFLAENLEVAADHLKAAAKRVKPYYNLSREAGRNADEWKRNLVIACVGLFRDLGLGHRVKKSPDGPLHSTINDIASLARLPRIGQSAFYTALEAVGISTATDPRVISD
jgi:hypothetical protein